MINASFVWDIYQKYKDIFSGGAVKKDRQKMPVFF